MEQMPICTNPRVILNPLAGEYISRFGCYVYAGRFVRINRRMAFFDKFFKMLSPRYKGGLTFVQGQAFVDPVKCSVDNELINSSYFLDPSTGEIFPMYLKVRCGHCDNCKASKVFSLVHRCKLESMSYKCLPIFLTLTYAEEFRPKDGVSVRAVQLFLKRLRINLERAGYRDKIRYLFVSEYGKTSTRRPHYHAIIWNLHQSDFVSYKEIGEILQKSWPFGFEMHRLVDLSDDKAFFYTSKYLGKGSDVPDGQNPTFCLCSNRGGAIGALFLATLAPEIRNHLNVEPKFLNPFSGKVEELQMSKYVLDKLFPTMSTQVTSKVRSAVKDFVLAYAALRTYEDDHHCISQLFMFDRTYHAVVDYFSKFMYIYQPEAVASMYKDSLPSLLRRLNDSESIITRFMSKHGVLFDPLDLHQKRQVFLTSLFSRIQQPDLDSRARKFRRLMDYSEQFLVL